MQGLTFYSLTAGSRQGPAHWYIGCLPRLRRRFGLLLFTRRSRCRCPGLRYRASLGKGPQLLVGVWHLLRAVLDGGGVGGAGGVGCDVGHIIHDHDLVHDVHVVVVGSAAARVVGVQQHPQLHTRRGLVAKVVTVLHDDPVLHDVLVQTMRGCPREVAPGAALGEAAPTDATVKVSVSEFWWSAGHMNLLSR